jgi:hypothetical protein
MSANFRSASALVWLGLGILCGVLVSGLWPSVPLHAVATDKIESFSMATGPVEAEYEAIYFLDHLTGELHAYVVGRTRNGFGVLQHSYRKILDDFKTDEEKTPKFIMTTGMADLTRGGRGQVMPSRSVLYVANVTSGMCGVYAMPYNTTAHTSGQFLENPLVLITSLRIRQPVEPSSGGKKGKSGSTARN